MPRGKKGQYALETVGDGGLAVVRVDNDTGGVPAVPGVQEASWRETAAVEAARIFETRDDGWYRLVPGGDGKATYHKWKFTRGKWANYYVMFQGVPGDFCTNILGLAHKLEQVDRGELRPAYDTFYDPR